MSIDKGWRGFLTGQNHLLLVKIIQEVTDDFVHDMQQEGFITKDISKDHQYQFAMKTTDLSKVRPLLHLDIDFDFGVAKLINFIFLFRRADPKRYYELKNSNDPMWVKMNKHMEFFRSAQSIIDLRNVNAHDQNPNNSSGNSLLTAGHVMTLVELRPKIKDSLDGTLQKNLVFLLNEIIQVENDQEQEEEQEEQELEKSPKIEEIPEKKIISEEIEFTNNLIDKMSFIMETKFDIGLNDFNESVSNIPIDIKNYMDEKFNELDFQTDVIIAKNSNQDFADEEVEPRARLKERVSNKVIEDKFEPSLKTSADNAIETNTDFYDEREISKTELRKFLTPSEADREMFMLQKRFKKETKCKNWENLAQGPIRNEILNHKICNFEEFKANPLIYEKYNRHKDVMDFQIRSQAGKDFFSILERITWN